MMESKDMNAGATASHNEESTRKRSHVSLDEAPEDDDRENISFQEIERCLLKEHGTEHGIRFKTSQKAQKRAKEASSVVMPSRIIPCEPADTMQAPLESPLWQRQQGESTLASSATNPGSLPASPFSPNGQERDQSHHDNTSPIVPTGRVTGQENQPWSSLFPQPQALMDAQASLNYAQVYGVYPPQGVAMLPQQQDTSTESAGQQQAAAAAAAANIQSYYAAQQAVYPLQYPGYVMAAHQAMPASNPEDPTNQQQQQYPVHLVYHQQDPTQPLVNDSSRCYDVGAPPEEEVERIAHPSVLMYTKNDADVLSDYQIFLRKQIEFFEADKTEVNTATPGRKKPVTLGQVGIRCRHCAAVAIPRRASAAVYFPSKLNGLYQAAQNIGTKHLRNTCPNLPDSLKEVAKTFQVDGKRASAGHGGKQYWSDAAMTLGIVEAQDGLRFFTPN